MTIEELINRARILDHHGGSKLIQKGDFVVRRFILYPKLPSLFSLLFLPRRMNKRESKSK